MVASNLDLHGDIGKPGDLDFTNLELSMNMFTMNKIDVMYKMHNNIISCTENAAADSVTSTDNNPIIVRTGLSISLPVLITTQSDHQIRQLRGNTDTF